MKSQVFSAVLFFILATTVSVSSAQNACTEIFGKEKQHRELLILEVRKNETAVQGFLSKVFAKPASRTPMFLKKTRSGEIPVLLANAKTYSALKSIFNTSLGIIVQHQPDYQNDHGMYRIGENLIDMDSPGYRARGEINQTGLAWVPVKNYLDYASQKNGYKRIEVLFQLEPVDYQVAQTYQLMRRAAIIRAPFSFNGAKTDLNQMNMLQQGGEHCFTFCSGSSIPSHLREMESNLVRLGFKNYKGDLEQTDFKAYLTEVQKQLAAAQARNVNDLNAKITLKLKLPKVLEDSLEFNQLDQKAQNEVLNWYVGYHFTTKYQELLNYLGIRGGNGFENFQSPKASAVVIYDGAVSDAEFSTDRYTSRGIFSTWNHAN